MVLGPTGALYPSGAGANTFLQPHLPFHPHSADQALDRFAMKRFYEDKVVPVGQPSQKRWVLARLCRLGFFPIGWLDAGVQGGCSAVDSAPELPVCPPGTSITSVGSSLAASR